VDLELAAGETAVLLGPNGAGKSTILSLLAGLYAPTSGAIAADGVPLEDLDLAELRRSMGVVTQDPLIFPASVRENISYGRPDADDAAIERAVELAGATAFIGELPGGLDARVGDDGVLLSGGQRRRIAIARALLGDPALVLLDEPTTHLDIDGAGELISRLTDAPRHPTVLIISHDPAVAAHADRLFRLRDGRLTEEEMGWGGDELAPSGEVGA
jgi:ATP-binding cassette subfamily B protein